MQRSYQCWILAIALDVLAMALRAGLAASTASMYGSLDAGRTTDTLLLELLTLMAVLYLARRTLEGADWARSLLVLVGVPYALFLVLHAADDVLPPESPVALLTDGASLARLLEAAMLASAIALMYLPTARRHFADPPQGR